MPAQVSCSSGQWVSACNHGCASTPAVAACRAVKKVQPVLGGFDKDSYSTDRLWATAPDGTKVPMSIVYKKGVARRDGTDPLLLDG